MAVAFSTLSRIREINRSAPAALRLLLFGAVMPCGWREIWGKSHFEAAACEILRFILCGGIEIYEREHRSKKAIKDFLVFCPQLWYHFYNLSIDNELVVFDYPTSLSEDV